MLLPILCLARAASPTVVVGVTELPIRVDGNLDEEAWQSAGPVTEFLRFQPTEGGPPPGTTEVRVLQDDRALYFGIRVRGADYEVRGRLSSREDINQDDQIGLYLDTFGDQRTGYIFYLNARGIQQDLRFNNGRWESSWNALFRSYGRVVEGGYDLEVALPFRSLKFPSGGGDQEWGFSVTRKIPHDNSKYGFPPRDRTARLFTDVAVLPVRPPGRGSGYELIPALTVGQSATTDDQGELAFNGFEPWHEAVVPSLDVRFGLTPNVGVAATLNPDFSQVESDTTQTSLNRRFALYYPEMRPFFLDGSDYYADLFGTLYSRSIVAPIYGVKAFGKEGPWAVAALQSVDRSPSGSVNEYGTPGFDDLEGEMASTALVRVQKDAFSHGYIGFTAADKRVLGDLAANDVLGIDLRVPIDARWTTSAGFMGSVTQGGFEPMLGTDVVASVSRAGGRGTGGSLSFSSMANDFRREMDYVAQTGNSNVAASMNQTWEPGGAVNTLTQAFGSSMRMEVSGDRRRDVYSRTSATIGGVHYPYLWASATDVREAGVEVLGGWLGGGWSGQLGRTLGGSASVEGGRILDYERMAEANAMIAIVQSTLRPFGGLRVDLRVRHDRIWPANGDREFASQGYTRLKWQFTRTLGLRVVEEYTVGTDFDAPQLLSSALLTWLRNPGTAVYLGYTETSTLGAAAATRERAVFGKVSVLIRP